MAVKSKSKTKKTTTKTKSKLKSKKKAVKRKLPVNKLFNPVKYRKSIENDCIELINLHCIFDCVYLHNVPLTPDHTKNALNDMVNVEYRYSKEFPKNKRISRAAVRTEFGMLRACLLNCKGENFTIEDFSDGYNVQVDNTFLDIFNEYITSYDSPPYLEEYYVQLNLADTYDSQHFFDEYTEFLFEEELPWETTINELQEYYIAAK